VSSHTVAQRKVDARSRYRKAALVQ
jgi:hypothetical protein